jgi:hypothetical protein
MFLVTENKKHPQLLVEIFKTNVQQKKHAAQLLTVLTNRFPFLKVNFDLRDRDKILRIEGYHVVPAHIIATMNECGYDCEILE